MQTQLAVRQANAANRSAMIAGGLSATGSIFGGLGAGGFFNS